MTRQSPFKQRVAEAVANERMRLAVFTATTDRERRRRELWSELADVQALRETARRIKDHTLDNLDRYLDRLIDRFEALGVRVHLASTAEEANAAVVEIARRYDCQRIVKSKSMLTEELHLNEALEEAGIDAIETDLGELLLQLEGDRPSHITAPAVHKDVASCAETVARHLHIPYEEDPKALVQAARQWMRDVFRRAEMAITGVNFAVAESGTIALTMNEGNGRFCTLRPRVHVAVLGVEKVVPTLADLAVMLKLLNRSASNQRMSVDTQFITGPRREGDADGPEHMHVVIVDAGRTAILRGPHREVLRCIRCAACLNICPVYRSIGGHAYGSVYPGPIGKLLTAMLSEYRHGAELPQASTLCGACLDACPVKIDIPRLLLAMRAEAVGRAWENRGKSRLLRLAMYAMRSPLRYAAGQRLLRFLLRRRARDGWIMRAYGPLSNWTAAQRDLKAPARRSFRDLWRKGEV